MRYTCLGEHRIQRVLSYVAAVLAGFYLAVEKEGMGFRLLGIALIVGGLGGLLAEFRDSQKSHKEE